MNKITCPCGGYLEYIEGSSTNEIEKLTGFLSIFTDVSSEFDCSGYTWLCIKCSNDAIVLAQQLVSIVGSKKFDIADFIDIVEIRAERAAYDNTI